MKYYVQVAAVIVLRIVIALVVLGVVFHLRYA